MIADPAASRVAGTPLPVLAPGFSPLSRYQREGYRLLPFRFMRHRDDRYLLTNLVGEYLLLSRGELQALVEHQLRPTEPAYAELKGKQFLYDGVSDVALELLANQYRTQQSALKEWTSLHLFVVTLRCDHSCPYCQVSRVSADRVAFDMSVETADRAIGLMLQSPAPTLKVEFQGGESLLNWELIQHVVRETRRRAPERAVEFVIATNLSPLTEEMLAFCREHSLFISTSLDGPEALHNANRPRPGNDSYARTVAGIARVREALGHDSVGALMTTTARSLAYPREIVDEYVRLGFASLFLRPLSPFGFAVRSAARIGHGTEAFIRFYREALAHILDYNRNGQPFREEFASIVLRKALTPYPNGFVDLQSPAGMGIAAVVYNYDGDVYASDEGRMLAENNDRTFRLGNVHQNSYRELFLESPLLSMLHETMAEGIPGCSDCAFLPWCGTDPVFHHATQGDMVGHRPTSAFCGKNMAIFRHLVDLLESDSATARILRGWAA